MYFSRMNPVTCRLVNATRATFPSNLFAMYRFLRSHHRTASSARSVPSGYTTGCSATHETHASQHSISWRRSKDLVADDPQILQGLVSDDSFIGSPQLGVDSSNSNVDSQAHYDVARHGQQTSHPTSVDHPSTQR